MERLLQLVDLLHVSDTQSVESVLLYGPRGAGKSGLAAHLAGLVKFSMVKVRGQGSCDLI